MPQNDRQFPGIEYHGIAGSSDDCREAAMRLLQYGTKITEVRILSYGRSHCLLFKNEIGDQIAVRSGFSSGYGGSGPRAFSYTLQLLNFHRIRIDEIDVDENTIKNIDFANVSAKDLAQINSQLPIIPSRWPDYIYSDDFETGKLTTKWEKFEPIIPFYIVEKRLTDIALNFWEDPDRSLMIAYRRLEDIIRQRTGLSESSSKLFAKAFLENDAKLTWKIRDVSECKGRANLFVSIYMAFRNPRAHREAYVSDPLREFLLVNQLFHLESEAVLTRADENEN